MGALDFFRRVSEWKVQKVRDLPVKPTNFIAVHNENAAPFLWRKKSVGPKGLKKRYFYLCK